MATEDNDMTLWHGKPLAIDRNSVRNTITDNIEHHVYRTDGCQQPSCNIT